MVMMPVILRVFWTHGHEKGMYHGSSIPKRSEDGSNIRLDRSDHQRHGSHCPRSLPLDHLPDPSSARLSDEHVVLSLCRNRHCAAHCCLLCCPCQTVSRSRGWQFLLLRRNRFAATRG